MLPAASDGEKRGERGDGRAVCTRVDVPVDTGDTLLPAGVIVDGKVLRGRPASGVAGISGRT